MSANLHKQQNGISDDILDRDVLLLQCIFFSFEKTLEGHISLQETFLKKFS